MEWNASSPAQGVCPKSRAPSPSVRHVAERRALPTRRSRPPAWSQVKRSADVLGRLDPLKHVAPFRKSQMQHALAEMVASILANNVVKGEPRCGAGRACWTSHASAAGLGASPEPQVPSAQTLLRSCDRVSPVGRPNSILCPKPKVISTRKLLTLYPKYPSTAAESARHLCTGASRFAREP